MKVKTKVWPLCPDIMEEAFFYHQNQAAKDPKKSPKEPTLRYMLVPEWFGREDFHSAHRAILLAKDPKYYVQFGWKETPAVKNLRGQYPYVWPVK